jgi:hypothetical protein
MEHFVHRENIAHDQRLPIPAVEVMNRRGIEFTLVRVEPDLWRWRFQIGETVSTGKTQTSLIGMAARRVRVRIDHELRKPRGLGQSPDAPQDPADGSSSVSAL